MAVRNRKSKPTTATKPEAIKKQFRPYAEIESDLNYVKCALACASFSLGQAQDTNDQDLSAKAWAVIHICVEQLESFENSLDSWHVHHDHSPKGVAHG